MLSKLSKKHYRFLLLALFAVAGTIITFTSVIIGGYYQLNIIDKKFNESTKNTLAYKQNYLHTQTENFKNYLTTLEKSSSFSPFLQQKQKKASYEKAYITDIMMTISNSHPTIMQFRFIDSEGLEIIKIMKDSILSSPYLVTENFLKNEAKKHYFKEIKELAKDKIWFSNIEIKPFGPTLSVAKAYYADNDFRGILIINIFMEDILNELVESETFNLVLIDKASHILQSNFTALQNTNNEIYTMQPSYGNFFVDLFFQKKYSSIELSDIIQNNEGLKLIIEDKLESLTPYTQGLADYIIMMYIVVLSISIPMILILSRYPAKLHEDMSKQLNIIDQYVCMSSTDLDGNITEVSEAYTLLSGYSKEELIGQNHRIIKDPSTPSSHYKQMWSTILSGETWNGEVRNLTKSGELFSSKVHICPIYEKNKIIGFNAIREDLTDQKRIEEISIRDELTQAYNRRFFNKTFPKELQRAKRKQEMFCIAMFDIDYFKNYNDFYGHIKGDEVLQKIVKQISSKLKRSSDQLFRTGGEEFMVIYSDMKKFDEAEKFARELVESIENLQIEHQKSEVASVVTVSMGLLLINTQCSMNENDILKRVDELLYKAKDSGRNRLSAQECMS